jgi:hypothetical protein
MRTRSCELRLTYQSKFATIANEIEDFAASFELRQHLFLLATLGQRFRSFLVATAASSQPHCLAIFAERPVPLISHAGISCASGSCLGCKIGADESKPMQAIQTRVSGETIMLTITNAAFSNLRDKLSNQPLEIAARLSRKDQRTRVRYGKQRPGDEVVEHDGRVVLLMDKSISQRLQHKVLDVRKTTDGPKLGLRTERKGPTAS